MVLKYHEYCIHVLRYIEKNGPTAGSKLRVEIPKLTGATDEELAKTSLKGTNIVTSRVYWAYQYLFQAEALSRPTRGVYQLTDLGRKMLNDHPQGISESVLKSTEGFKKWAERSGNKVESEIESVEQLGLAPEESIEQSIANIESAVASEIVARLQEMSPIFLEKSVLELLRAMGYGIDDDSLQHTGGPGDEGVDGVINQDRLGIQRIYVQAKRYKDGSKISRETIQAFIGALQGASGGVFITTSEFSLGAREFASKHLSPRIILIDGITLGKLLVKYEVGAVAKKNYKIVEIDENYFEED